MIKATQLFTTLFAALLINTVANAADVQVSNVESISQRLVSVSGTYFNTCRVDLKPEISEILPNSHRPVALIKLIPAQTSGICQQVEREFEFSLVIDLDKMAFDHLGEFDLAFVGGDSLELLTVTVAKPYIQNNFDKTSIQGNLNNEDGKYMVVNPERTYQLAANTINADSLEKYVGKAVLVSGYVFNDNANTIQDPLSSDFGHAQAPTVVIESIQAELSHPMTTLRQTLTTYKQM